jgi:hypothetical protein
MTRGVVVVAAAAAVDVNTTIAALATVNKMNKLWSGGRR